MSTMFDMFGGAPMQRSAPAPMRPMNPMQRMQEMMRAMQNPAAYVSQKFPDIPQEIRNDPGRIMSYLQQSRNIGEQDMNNMAGQARQYYNGM